MKFILPALLISLTNICLANKIDSLKTIEDVETFVLSIAKKQIIVFPIGRDTTGINGVKFFKIDFDNNGRTDLFVNGSPLFVVIDKGLNKYEISYVGSQLDDYRLINIDSNHKSPFIVVLSQDTFDYHQNKKIIRKPDTLIYKFNCFVELNINPQKKHLKRIEYETHPCFGTCDVFTLIIDSSQKATLKMEQYPNSIFKATIDDSTYKNITGLIGYIKLDSLLSNYETAWTDEATVDLKIIYNNSSKSIQDYGKRGTFGLLKLYWYLDNLFFSQKWNKIDIKQ